MRDQATIHIDNTEHRLQQRASLNLISTRSVSRETCFPSRGVSWAISIEGQAMMLLEC